MKRRAFLSALAILPVITALGGAGLKLRDPFRPVQPDPTVYFTGSDSWFVMTDAPNGLKKLDEAALEEMCRDLRVMSVERQAALLVEPRYLLIQPAMLPAAHRVMARASWPWWRRVFTA